MMILDLFLEVGMEAFLCGNYTLTRILEEMDNRKKQIQFLNLS
jgi:hypothetical protein